VAGPRPPHGSASDLTVYRLVINDSVEERNHELASAKNALLTEDLFAGEKFGKLLSVEELTALLQRIMSELRIGACRMRRAVIYPFQALSAAAPRFSNAGRPTHFRLPTLRR